MSRALFLSPIAGAALSRVLGFEFRGHDLRRTAATRVYDRYSHDPEKRVALETWEKELSRILAARPTGGAMVVPMAKRARARSRAGAG